MMRCLLKILAMPLILVLKMFCMVVNALAKVSAYVLSPLVLFVLGCGIYCIFKAKWSDVAILVSVEAIIFAAMFGMGWLTCTVEEINDNLRRFVRS